MKILLVKPPDKDAFNFGTFSLAVLAASVRDQAQVSVFDATELDSATAAAEVLRDHPDLVGVTVMGLPSIAPAVEFIRAVRAETNGRGPPIVVGGHGAGPVPDRMLDAGADAVVIGEGEATFREIISEGIHEGVPGLVLRIDGATVFGPPRPLVSPLSRIGMPARDLVAPPPSGVHLVETSRGCPHACTFCETTRYHGRRWRPHTPERVVAEFREVMERHDAWIIQIADDNFTASPRRVLHICEQLQEGLLPALCMASSRADDLLRDRDLLPAMARARMLRITVGVETFDPREAELIDKLIPAEIYVEAFRQMRELDIFSVASFIVGLPGGLRPVEDTVAAAVEAGPDSAHFVPFLPMPGTPLAAGAGIANPDPEAVSLAGAATRGFYGHPRTVSRLKEKAGREDPVGVMARVTLEKYCS